MAQTIIIAAIAIAATAVTGYAMRRQRSNRNTCCPTCGQVDCEFSRDPQRHCPVNWEL